MIFSYWFSKLVFDIQRNASVRKVKVLDHDVKLRATTIKKEKWFGSVFHSGVSRGGRGVLLRISGREHGASGLGAGGEVVSGVHRIGPCAHLDLEGVGNRRVDQKHVELHVHQNADVPTEKQVHGQSDGRPGGRRDGQIGRRTDG